MNTGPLQEAALYSRLHRSEGFTLIELMVVVMIVAVLVGLGIPTFLGFRSRAQDSAATHTLTVAHKTTFVVGMEEGGFPSAAVLAATLPVVEPVFGWVDDMTDSTGPGIVSVADDAGGTELALAVVSKSGSCFYLRMSLTAGIAKHSVDDAPSCRADDFRDGAGSGW